MKCLTARTVCMAALTAALSACAMPQGDTIGRFDFRYTIRGSAPHRPYQVFDDGTATYLQFTGEPPPELTVSLGAPTAGVPQHATRRGPYLFVPAVANALVVGEGDARVQIRYTGPTRGERKPAASTAVNPGDAATGLPPAPSACTQGGTPSCR